MTIDQFNKLKIGDYVILNVNTKGLLDHAGDKVKIKEFTKDGVGVIFTWSDLGVHYSKISIIE